MSRPQESILISIVVTMYNVEGFLTRCLGSLVPEVSAFEDIELVLLDDGSSDGTRGVAEFWRQRFPQKVRLLRNPHNLGVGRSRNIAWRNARGRYIWYVDADDWVESSLLGAVREAIVSKPHLDALLLRMRIFDERESTYRDHWSLPLLTSLEHRLRGRDTIDTTARRGLLSSPIAIATKVLRRSLFDAPPFTQRRRAEDLQLHFELWSNVAMVRVLLEPRYIYRSHPGQLTVTDDETLLKPLRAVRDTSRTLRSGGYPRLLRRAQNETLIQHFLRIAKRGRRCNFGRTLCYRALLLRTAMLDLSEVILYVRRHGGGEFLELVFFACGLDGGVALRRYSQIIRKATRWS